MAGQRERDREVRSSSAGQGRSLQRRARHRRPTRPLAAPQRHSQCRRAIFRLANPVAEFLQLAGYDPAQCEAIFDRKDGLAVAEGIETSADLDTVRQLGCDLAQGFLFAEAMPKARLLEFVAEARSSEGFAA